MLPDLEMRRQNLARRALGFIVVLILSFVAMDWISLGYFPVQTLAVRVAWATTVLLLRSRLPTTYARYVLVIRFVLVSAVVYLIAISAMTGGSHGLIFPFFPMLPLVALVFTQDDGQAIWDILIGSAAGMTGILLLEGAAPGEFARWLGLCVSMGCVALYGASLYRRRRAVEMEMDAERIRALEALAASERQRAHSEKLALIGQLAAGVAHEINNPLAFSLSNLGYIEKEVPMEDEDLAGAFTDLRVGLERIEQIVRDLKTFSRADDARPDVVDLSQVIDEAIRIAGLKVRGVARVQKELPPGLPSIRAPYGRVVQVLVNLIVNASDALESSSRSHPTITVRVQREGEHVRVFVDDNGPGLPAGAEERIFEPFFTTKPPGKGTGLGLPLSRDFVQRWGGDLSACNREDGGARFSLTVPTAELAEPAPIIN